MEFKNQEEAVSMLKKASESDIHTILLHGESGCGKTYLARKYAKYVNAVDFAVITSKMDSVREFMDTVYDSDEKIVVCIENLDSAVSGVAQAILKFLEEPPKHVYIIVTARDVNAVPNTIISRSMMIYVPHFQFNQLMQYAKETHGLRADSIANDLKTYCRNPADVDFIMKLQDSDLWYLNDVYKYASGEYPIATITWKLQSFPSGEKIPIRMMIRSLYRSASDDKKRMILCYESDIGSGVPDHVILSAIIMNLKY